MTRAGLFRWISCDMLAAFVLLPLVQAVALSFTVTLGADGVPAGTSGFHNYASIFRSPALRQSLVNSGTYVLLNVSFCLIAGLPAAYALARYNFVGDRHFLLFLLVFRVTPPVVLSLPIFILFSRLGLVNSPLGIALVHCVFNCRSRSGSWKASSPRSRALSTRWRSSTVTAAPDSSFGS